jgi:excisionase family DNA binding protein
MLTVGDLPNLLQDYGKRIARLEQQLAAYTQQEHVEQWLSVDEAAKFVGLAKQTVYQLVSERKIPYHKAGRQLRFYKSELNKWILGN